jgi:hypothetical protein
MIGELLKTKKAANSARDLLVILIWFKVLLLCIPPFLLLG